MPNEGKPVLGFWRGQQRDLDSVTRDWAIPVITVFLLERGTVFFWTKFIKAASSDLTFKQSI